MRRIKSQRGDTIIEVMLAIAVIAMVLGASYATATRALRAGRYAQEQTEALKIAESQLEQIKHMASLNIAPGTINDIFNGSAGQDSFCVWIEGPNSFRKSLVGSAEYTANCSQVSSQYAVTVNYIPRSVSPRGGIFEVNVAWDRTGSTQRGTVQVSARVFQ